MALLLCITHTHTHTLNNILITGSKGGMMAKALVSHKNAACVQILVSINATCAGFVVVLSL